MASLLNQDEALFVHWKQFKTMLHRDWTTMYTANFKSQAYFAYLTIICYILETLWIIKASVLQVMKMIVSEKVLIHDWEFFKLVLFKVNKIYCGVLEREGKLSWCWSHMAVLDPFHCHNMDWSSLQRQTLIWFTHTAEFSDPTGLDSQQKACSHGLSGIELNLLTWFGDGTQ